MMCIQFNHRGDAYSIGVVSLPVGVSLCESTGGTRQFDGCMDHRHDMRNRCMASVFASSVYVELHVVLTSGAVFVIIALLRQFESPMTSMPT